MIQQPDILVFVDDEPNILSALKRELAAWAQDNSIEIHTYTSGAEALVQVEQLLPRILLVVSDSRMPGMSGGDFLLKVRELKKEIPVMLLSGYSDAPDLMKAIKAGITSFILKPWDHDYLLAEIGRILDGARLRKENEKLNKRLSDDLAWAGELQRLIMQPKIDKLKDLEVQSFWRPLPELKCGGDYLDCLPTEPGRAFLLMGDVAGHGLRASLVTAMLKSIVKQEYVDQIGGGYIQPSEFLSWLNERIFAEITMVKDLMITLLAIQVDKNAGIIEVANAGHCKPFVIRNHVAYEIPVTGTALGVSKVQKYASRKVTVASGDVIFMYTDGLLELDPGNERILEVGSLGRIIASTPYGKEWPAEILQSALRTTAATTCSDDVAMLSVKL